MTASAIAAAALSPLGPPAATQIGTSAMSYQVPVLSRNSISVSSPRHLWVTRSPRSNPRATVTASTSSRMVAGRLPMERKALLAVPIPRKVRPGARAFRVATEFAVTGAIRGEWIGDVGAHLDGRCLLRGQRHLLVRVGEQQRPFPDAEMGHPKVLGLLDQPDLVDLGAGANTEVHGCSPLRFEGASDGGFRRSIGLTIGPVLPTRRAARSLRMRADWAVRRSEPVGASMCAARWHAARCRVFGTRMMIRRQANMLAW